MLYSANLEELKPVRRLSLLVILFLPIALQAQQSPIQPTWDPLSFFVGHWRGTSQGEPGHGEGNVSMNLSWEESSSS